MDNLNLALLSSPSSSSSNWVLGKPNRPLIYFPHCNYQITPRSSSLFNSSFRRFSAASASHHNVHNGKLGGVRCFASISSGEQKQTASVGVNPCPLPLPSSNVGSPLFWVGVGVGLSALFSWVASYLKKYAMQQAFKTMMNQMNTQNNQFNNSPFPLGSTFPFPTLSSAGSPASPSRPPFSSVGPATSQFSVASQPSVTVDVPATKVEVASTTDVKEEKDSRSEAKKYAFVDVPPDETLLNSPSKNVEDASDASPLKEADFAKEVSSNGSASSQGPSVGSQFIEKAGPGLSVEALEKMMEDPTVQKMVYLYLPEEMRNPTTFKWMLQNPQYRQQLQDMLNNLGGSGEWDNQMMDSLKNFDLSSPEVKQQFDQIGLTPEEVISEIMANPDVALAFQNPKIQQAIMECSQNPLSITKYQNDKEVMDVFNKISELFPGVSGPP